MQCHLTGNPAVLEPMLLRPVALRLRLSTDLPLTVTVGRKRQPAAGANANGLK